MEQRAVIKFNAKLGKSASKTFRSMQQVYGSQCLGRTAVFEWHKRFLEGREKHSDVDHRANENRQLSQHRTKNCMDYRQLGIDELCLRCGRNNHVTKECKIDHSKLKCSSCNKAGHCAKVCISTLLQEKGKNNRFESSTKQLEESHDDYGISHSKVTKKKKVVDIFNQSIKESLEKIYSVPNGFAYSLGRIWIRHLYIQLEEIDTEIKAEIRNVRQIYSSNDIIKQYPIIFTEKIGFVNNFKVTLKLSERERVDKELDSLEAVGIISKTTFSDWGSPLAVIFKSDESVCVDYKTEMNSEDLKKTEAYFDDIIVHGATTEECMQNLCACLQRFQELNLHKNKNTKLLAMTSAHLLRYASFLSRIIPACLRSQVLTEPKAPHHPWESPQTNWDRIHIDYARSFEGNVQTLKQHLKCMAENKSPMEKKIQTILFQYRATPLTLQLRIEERVQVRYVVNNKAIWKYGTITNKVGLLHYYIILDEGPLIKRHID
ncbi:GVQW3 protein, partial [Acromyrmex charruanus]